MKLNLKFRLEKETKGAVQYKEFGESSERMAVGTLYVRKSALPTPYPQELTVVIEDTL